MQGSDRVDCPRQIGRLKSVACRGMGSGLDFPEFFSDFFSPSDSAKFQILFVCVDFQGFLRFIPEGPGFLDLADCLHLFPFLVIWDIYA